MSSQETPFRVFLFHEDLAAADHLALPFWNAGFECWPFSQIEAMASSFKTIAPHLAFLHFSTKHDALQVTILIASLCPDCRFIVFTHGGDVGQQSGQAYRRGANYEVFVLSPNTEQLLHLAHVARNQRNSAQH